MSKHESASAGKPPGEKTTGTPGPRKRRRKRRRKSKGPAPKDQTPTYDAVENQEKSQKQTEANKTKPATEGSKGPSKPKPQKEGKKGGNRHPYARGQNRHHPNRGGKWQHVYAALDLGTNNCRLLVARPREEGFKVIDAFSRTVRLGEGLSAHGALTDEAMDRAIEALKVCAQKMRRRGVTRAHCIATEACRTASNGLQFIERAEKETGLTFEVISTAQEARFAAAGCAPLLDRKCEKALVFDIGGGSTELIWLDLLPLNEGQPEPEIAAWTSIPFGVVTLAEHYKQKQNYEGRSEIDVYNDMVAQVRTSILAFKEAEQFSPTFEAGKAHLIGNSGTVTTLAAVHLGLKRYDRSRVDGIWVASDDMSDLVSNLSKIGIEGRAKNSCIGLDRADLLLPGCAILTAIQDTWPSKKMRVADRGLREGILIALMEKADQESGGQSRRRKRRRGARKASKQERPAQNPEVAP